VSECGFLGVAIRDVQADSYVAWGQRAADGNRDATFTIRPVSPFDSRSYTIDVIDMNNGGWGHLVVSSIQLSGCPITV